MAGWTNRGKFMVLGWAFVNLTIPTNYYLALLTSAHAPDADDDVFASPLIEIAAGNGYAAGGYQLTPGSTDFDVHTEDDVNDRGLVQIKDVVWTASGGNIPDSGDGARYAILTDDNVTQALREVYFYWDLTSDRTVSDGQTLTLVNCETRINES
jgi:hypothetical protein